MDQAPKASPSSVATYAHANLPILVPVIEVLFEDFLILAGLTMGFFLVGAVLGRLTDLMIVSLAMWAAGIAASTLCLVWLKKTYRERGDLGGREVLLDAGNYLIRSRRMPGRKFHSLKDE